MKSINLAILVLCCARCFAADETNIIVATDWSEPVGFGNYSLRGRLLIVTGNEPAYGGPKTENLAMTFVELQNLNIGGSLKVYFDVMGLSCELSDKNGEPLPKPAAFGWGGRGPLTPSWVVLPYNSTIRLFVNSGSRSPLMVFPSGEPWSRWSLQRSGTNIYYLSGSLNISTLTNATLTAVPHESVNPHEYAEWNGKLVFPKVKISAGQVIKQN